MPISNGESQVILHPFALYKFGGVVVFEGEWVFRAGSFVGDFRDAGEECFALAFHGEKV